MKNETLIQFNKSLFEVFPNLVTNEIGKKFLYMYNLNGMFGKTIKDFFELNKKCPNLIQFCTKNEFYIYCTDEETENYFYKVKKWGINIVKIKRGEVFFFEKETKTTKKEIQTNKLIKRGRKIVPKLQKIKIEEQCFNIKSKYKDFFMPKFDRATMNPPYDGNLHLKVLEGTINFADEIVNISPIRWLEDPLYKFKNASDFNKFQSILTHIVNIDKVSREDFYKIFGMSSSLNLGKYKLNASGGWNPNTFNTNEILNKTFSVMEEKKLNFIKDKIEHDKLDGWRVRILTRAPIETDRMTSESVKTRKTHLLHYKLSFVYKDGYTKDNVFWSKNRLPGAGNKTYEIGTPIHDSIKFDSEIEAVNFEKYTKTNFFKYIFSVEKTGDETPLYLPFMDNYKIEWTDKELCDYFGISGYISDTNAEKDSEWELILKKLEEYK